MDIRALQVHIGSNGRGKPIKKGGNRPTEGHDNFLENPHKNVH